MIRIFFKIVLSRSGWPAYSAGGPNFGNNILCRATHLFFFYFYLLFIYLCIYLILLIKANKQAWNHIVAFQQVRSLSNTCLVTLFCWVNYYKSKLISADVVATRKQFFKWTSVICVLTCYLMCFIQSCWKNI